MFTAIIICVLASLQVAVVAGMVVGLRRNGVSTIGGFFKRLFDVEVYIHFVVVCFPLFSAFLILKCAVVIIGGVTYITIKHACL